MNNEEIRTDEILQDEEIRTDEVLQNEEIRTDEVLQDETTESIVTPAEIIPSMDEFKEELNSSFKTVAEGDIIKGVVIGVSDTEVTVDLGYYAEAIIKAEELSNDPRFSMKSDIKNGDEISAIVLKEDDGHGNILLSLKRAADVLAWEHLKDLMDSKEICSIKIAQAVNGGVITYLEGIRAFVPASQLSLSYVENLESWVGKTIDVIVITVDEEKSKVVLSGKEVERERALNDKKSKISKLQIGLVTTGIIEKMTPYGVFVRFDDGLSGLVHISQICGRRIKSPKEIVKEGEEVKVKIIDIKDGKISLSMKAVEDRAEVLEDASNAPAEYISSGSVTTGLGALLKGLKLD